MQRIPPLPADWPFAPRAPISGLLLREDQVLPGLDGRWRLLVREAPPIAESERLSEAYGRGGVRRVGDWVLRPYRRGGLLRHVNERTYATTKRFADEYRVHEALWNAGFPTVEPLGYALRRRAIGWEGCYATRWVLGTPWPRRWEAGAAALPALVGLLDALVTWGLWAPDLNATNFLLTEQAGVLALDWDRARWLHPRAGLGRRYAERLRRSLLRLEAPPDMAGALEDALPPAWRLRR